MEDLDDVEWMLAGHNLRQDPHFSTYYLRQSTYLGQDSAYNPYSKLVALYSGLEEKYYLPKSEAVDTAEYLIRWISNNTGEFQTLLDEIERRSDELSMIWDSYPLQDPFEGLGLPELADIYEEHHTTHTDLYRVARVPEALDRGVPTFTNYLHKRLDEELDSKSDYMFSHFNRLTAPKEPSLVRKEIGEFQQLLNDIAVNDPAAGSLSVSAEVAQLLLSRGSLRKIQRHRQEWGFLQYHGYTDRSLSTLQDYVRRAKSQVEVLNDSEAVSVEYLTDSERSELFDEYGISSGLRSLLSFYPQIGQTKLYRRFCQLKNFYYLDKLLCKMAERLNTREVLLRHLSPEELYSGLLEADIPVSRAEKRLGGCAYLIGPESRGCLTPCDIQKLSKSLINTQEDNVGPIEGMGITDGVVEGVAHVVGSGDSAESREFTEGDILVSQATDPDLMYPMMQASAVVTEQGGVTSHAAIVSRELSIPTIVGVNNLFNQVSDGDKIRVDAQSGLIQVIEEADPK